MRSMAACAAVMMLLAAGVAPAMAQERPDLTGVWSLASRPMTSTQGYPALAFSPEGQARVDAYRALAPQLPKLLNPGGLAAVEIGADQAQAVNAMLARDGLQACVAEDLGSRPRAILLTWI